MSYTPHAWAEQILLEVGSSFAQERSRVPQFLVAKLLDFVTEVLELALLVLNCLKIAGLTNKKQEVTSRRIKNIPSKLGLKRRPVLVQQFLKLRAMDQAASLLQNKVKTYPGRLYACSRVYHPTIQAVASVILELEVIHLECQDQKINPRLVGPWINRSPWLKNSPVSWHLNEMDWWQSSLFSSCYFFQPKQKWHQNWGIQEFGRIFDAISCWKLGFFMDLKTHYFASTPQKVRKPKKWGRKDEKRPRDF